MHSNPQDQTLIPYALIYQLFALLAREDSRQQREIIAAWIARLVIEDARQNSSA